MAADNRQLEELDHNGPEYGPSVEASAGPRVSTAVATSSWGLTQNALNASDSVDESTAESASSRANSCFLVGEDDADQQSIARSSRASSVSGGWQFVESDVALPNRGGKQRHVDTYNEPVGLSDFDFGPTAVGFGESSKTAFDVPELIESKDVVATVSSPVNASSPSMMLVTNPPSSGFSWTSRVPEPIRSLPFFQYKSMLPAQVILTPQTSDNESGVSVLASPDPDAELISSRALIEAHFSGHGRETGSTRTLDDGLSALLPERVLGNPPSQELAVASTSQSSNAITYPDLMIFLMSNKLLDLTSKSVGKVYQWIRRSSGFQSLENLVAPGGPTVEALLEQLLILAVERDDPRTLKKVLRLGRHHLDLDIIKLPQRLGPGLTPLGAACHMQSASMIKILLKAGADVNVVSGDYTCLDLALGGDEAWEPNNSTRDMNAIWPLLKAGARMDSEDSVIDFSDIVRDCQGDLIAALLAHGADPNGKDVPEFLPPLMAAVQSTAPISDILRVCQLLIDAGADVQATFWDDEGLVDEGLESVSVLQSVHRPQHIELLEFLVKAGAQIEEEELLYAIEDDNEPALRFFLDSGARITGTILQKAVSQSVEIFNTVWGRADASTKEQGLKMAFFAAIKFGNMELLLSLSQDIPKSEYYYEKEFHEAINASASRGDVSMFRFLLSDESPCRSIIKSRLGDALCYAIRGDRTELIGFLLAAGADVDARVRNPRTTTPLLEAIRRKDHGLSVTLLQAGPRLDWIDYGFNSHRVSVLEAAVACGDLTLIRSLIAAGVDVNASGPDEGGCPLITAVTLKNNRAVEILIDAGADPNSTNQGKHGKHVLKAALETFDTIMVTYLLDHGADPCECCFVAAVRYCDVSMLRTLWRNKSRRYKRWPQGLGTRALQYAIASGRKPSIDFLVSHHVDTNFIVREPFPDIWARGVPSLYSNDESAFRTALRLTKDHTIIKKMLRYGANPSNLATEGRNSTPLLTTIERKDVDMVKILLKAGAVVNPVMLGKCRVTPLQAAAETGSMSITKLLILHGADVNAPPCKHPFGATALQFAARQGSIGIASLLLDHDAQVDAPPGDNCGSTALEWAAEYGRIDMVQFLVDAGSVLVGSGETQYTRARSFALKEGHRAVWNLLGTCHARQLENELFT